MPESAVMDAPEAEAPMTPIGEVWEQAMAKAQGGEQNDTTAATEPEKATPEAEATTKEQPEVKEAPKSALEAALAEPEKPQTTEEEFPEVLPNEGRKDHWARARAKMKADGERLATMERELAEAKSQPKGDPEAKATIEKLQAQLDEYKDTITAVNIELDPEFRSEFIDGRKNLIAKAGDKLKAYGGNPEALADALALPEGRRRDEAILAAMPEDISDAARMRILGLVDDVQKLDDKAAEVRANSQQSFEKLTVKQQQKLQAQQQEMEQRKAQTFEAVTKQLQTQVGTLRKVDATLEGAEEWNTGIDTSFAKAQQLFGPEATPEATVAAAIKGSDYDRVVGLLSTAWKDNAQMKKQLAEFESAAPDVRGGKAPEKQGLDALLDKSPGDIFMETRAKLSASE